MHADQTISGWMSCEGAIMNYVLRECEYMHMSGRRRVRVCTLQCRLPGARVISCVLSLMSSHGELMTVGHSLSTANSSVELGLVRVVKMVIWGRRGTRLKRRGLQGRSSRGAAAAIAGTQVSSMFGKSGDAGT